VNVSLAVLADYSNISKEGKLNILGIFTNIRARAFPLVLPAMQLVMTFESPYSEGNTTKDVRIKLMDDEGKQIIEIGGQLTLKSGSPGEMIKNNQIINFNNITFPKSGSYVFCILIGGEEKKRVPLKIDQIPVANNNPK